MEKYILHLKKNNYSKSTIETYKSILNTYKDDLSDIRLIKNKFKYYQKNPSTVSTHYAVIHAYMKFTKDKRISSLEEFILPHRPHKYYKVMTKEYIYQRTEDTSCNKKAIIRFMFETGIRVSELKSIIRIEEQTLTIKGKGNKIREVFHNKETTYKIKNLNYSSKTIRLWVKEILGSEFTPHSIRRSHATHLLLSGANPKMVMIQLGHSRIETTFRYLHSTKDENMSIYNKHF